jgi:hypothetical protein
MVKRRMLIYECELAIPTIKNNNINYMTVNKKKNEEIITMSLDHEEEKIFH